MNRTTFAARLRRFVLVVCASLVVLLATLAVLTGADVVPADANARPTAVAVMFNGVAAPAGNYARSTVTLCPQTATIGVRFQRPANGKPLAHRKYAIYWSFDGTTWHSSTGRTARDGTASQHVTGRLEGIQISGDGYNHYFAVRYRTCTTSVGKVQVSPPYGVRGNIRPQVSITGTLYAERRNGAKILYPHGRVDVRDNRTGKRVATLQAGSTGTFTGRISVPATTGLTVAAASAPTGSTRPVSYGRSWIPKPTRTAVVTVPAWMSAGVRFTPNYGFSSQVAKYAGGFADPAVMRVGTTYYAASTTGSGLNLPVMSSRDLTSWRPRAALPSYDEYSSWPGFNDAMPQAPAWAARTGTRENVKRISQWAPSLAQVGPHRFIAAFSAATKATDGTNRHSCIGLAVARQPAGPYRPFGKALLCDPTTKFGVIDPDLFVDPRTHHVYLVWAAEGIPHHRRAQLAIRQLNAVGSWWAKGSRRHNLLTFSQKWEGVIMENPSMIRYRGTLYLFYSGNSWNTSHYATGYAICRSVAGPCTKPRRGPLLRSVGAIAGPGGADAFVDRNGTLRLAYAAWQRGHAGQNNPGRVLHIATLKRVARGRLVVRRMSE